MDNLEWKWMKWMGKRQKDNWHCLQQSLQVSSQEVFHRDAAATDDKSPLRLEQLFCAKDFLITWYSTNKFNRILNSSLQNSQKCITKFSNLIHKILKSQENRCCFIASSDRIKAPHTLPKHPPKWPRNHLCTKGRRHRRDDGCNPSIG